MEPQDPVSTSAVVRLNKAQKRATIAYMAPHALPHRLVLGAAIAALRNAVGRTQADLAGAAGIAPSTLVRIEGGTQQPTAATAVAVADALGVSLDAISVRITADGRLNGTPRRRGEQGDP